MKIAIAGYGLEGKSSYRYWSKDGKNDITIFDQKPIDETPADAKIIFGREVFSDLNGYDLVVRTASLPPRDIVTDGKIWSSTNEFFDKCPAVIIGVTGSKGKGTTASYIASMLEAAGKKTWLVGNIGQPPLDVLDRIMPEDIVVFELSSFQLWDIEKSPHVAVVLFIEQEHLDVHKDMNEYISAKSNIAKYQTEDDFIIYKNENEFSKLVANKSVGKKIGYQSSDTAHVKNGAFYYGEQKICSVNDMKIVGFHNLDNVCAAIDAVWNITDDVGAIRNGILNFQGLDHRLQFVRELNGVKYYDDSIATTPTSAISALKSFKQHKIIILGGSYKGSDFTELVSTLKETDVYAILIGKEGIRIKEACDKIGYKNYEYFDGKTMESIVKRAEKLSHDGDVVLLSPSAASFDMFKNYADRGDKFKAAVMSLESN